MLLWHFEGEAKKYERLLQCVEVFHAYGVGSDECVGVSVWGIESNNPEDCCSDISLKCSLEKQWRIMQKEGQ